MLKAVGDAVCHTIIVVMYRVTESWLETFFVLFTIGVRQGSSKLYLLFIIYVNDLICIIKEGCGYDGVLVLMDDSILLSTTSKIFILHSDYSDCGIVVNQTFSFFNYWHRS